MPKSNPVALVTGAHSGIGRAIADTLAKKEYRVYGTSRTKRPDREGVEMVELDLRSAKSIEACAKQVEDRAGQIDLLVNNAAVTIVTPVEELPLDFAKEMMQVNFYGPAQLTNQIIPGMRERKSGRLIFISSLSGRMGVPGQGYYCSTKHALEGYADALYTELARFGVNVTLLEPGSFRTDVIENSPHPHWRTIRAYDGVREGMRDIIEAATEKGADPQLVADVVLRAALARKPKLRYLVDADGKRAMFLKKILPESIFYAALAKRFEVPPAAPQK